MHKKIYFTDEKRKGTKQERIKNGKWKKLKERKIKKMKEKINPEESKDEMKENRKEKNG